MFNIYYQYNCSTVVHKFISSFCHTYRVSLSDLFVSVVIQLNNHVYMLQLLHMCIEFAASQSKYLPLQLPVFFSMYSNSCLFVSTLIHASIYQFIATLPHSLILILILILILVLILILIFLPTITLYEIMPHFSILHYIILHIITPYLILEH